MSQLSCSGYGESVMRLYAVVMGVWAMLGSVLSVAVGVVQMCGGDWTGAFWSVGGVALGYWAYRLKRG